MSALLGTLEEILKERDFYFHSRHNANMRQVEDVLFKVVEHLRDLEQKQRNHEDNQLELKAKIYALENALHKERTTKADRSQQEKELVALVTEAKKILGPLSYAGAYSMEAQNKVPMKNWLKKVFELFLKNSYHKDSP